MAPSAVVEKTVTFLEGPFDPSSLSPGLYGASSDNEAFGLLRSLVVAELAEVEGERFLPDGTAVITARVLGERRRQNPVEDEAVMHEMTLGPEFFVNITRDYESWEVKWWREVVQNAVDAGATKIDLGVEDTGDGKNRVWCQDNGKGMSREILLTKYLKFGATTKVGEAGVSGGFGRAKELILLPWVSWRIVTGETEAVGTGTLSKVTTLPKRATGTLVEAYMLQSVSTRAYAAMEFLQRSYLPKVKFTVNGEPFAAKLKATKEVNELAGKAIFYVLPASSTQYSMYIRVNGLYMFQKWLTARAEAIVVVELLGPSVKLMTSNRDGIADNDLRREIDDFGNRIAADVSSALKEKKGIVRKRFSGTGKFRVKERQAEAIATFAHITTSEMMKKAPEEVALLIDYMAKQKKSDPAPEDDAPKIDVGAASAESAKAMMAKVPANPLLLARVVKQLIWEPDYLLTNEIPGFKSLQPFLPASMLPRVLRLLKVWTELCRFVLIQLGSETEYGVGFVFSNSVAAMAETGPEKWLLLNPFKAHAVRSGKLDYRVVVSFGGKTERRVLAPGKDEDLRLLYALAIHECTHIADGVDAHDEAFSTALTMNIARCASGWAQVKKIVAGIKMAGGMKADVVGKGKGKDDEDEELEISVGEGESESESESSS